MGVTVHGHRRVSTDEEAVHGPRPGLCAGAGPWIRIKGALMGILYRVVNGIMIEEHAHIEGFTRDIYKFDRKAFSWPTDPTSTLFYHVR